MKWRFNEAAQTGTALFRKRAFLAWILVNAETVLFWKVEVTALNQSEQKKTHVRQQTCYCY